MAEAHHMIEKLVVWGGRHGLESHRWIHRGFFSAAKKMGIPSVWVDDVYENQAELTPGAVVISADIWNRCIRAVPGVRYVLHNYDGSHPIFHQVEPERILRIQVWTNDAEGEDWGKCRAYHREGRVLFQPWGTDLLAEEFLDPVFNPHGRDVAFVGAVWSDVRGGQDLGNASMIDELRLTLADFGLRFVHLTQVSDEENMSAVRSGRLAPAFAGGWQVAHNYLPCRGFKNISYGVACLTNVPVMQELLGDTAIPGQTLDDVLRAALALHRVEYLNLVRAQQRVVANYSYRESLETIDRALEEANG
jgi:hypothetical protein